jgi:hypothetical protein
MPSRTLPSVRPARLKSIDRSLELAWISQHRGEYQGEWVVLEGDRLIGHGTDPNPIVEQARSQGIERPLVARIEEDTVPATGGWL